MPGGCSPGCGDHNWSFSACGWCDVVVVLHCVAPAESGGESDRAAGVADGGLGRQAHQDWRHLHAHGKHMQTL